MESTPTLDQQAAVAAAAAPIPEDEQRLLTAEEILGLDDLDYKDIHIPEWKGTVRIRSLSALDALEYFRDVRIPAKKDDAMLLIIIKSVVDVAGNRVFKPAQIDMLRKRNFRVFARLQDEILVLNGFNKDQKKQEAESKNASGEAAGDASPTN